MATSPIPNSAAGWWCILRVESDTISFSGLTYNPGSGAQHFLVVVRSSSAIRLYPLEGDIDQTDFS